MITQDPHYYGNHAILKAKASYYAGGALPDSEVTWIVTSNEASYAPPGLAKYTFKADNSGEISKTSPK